MLLGGVVDLILIDASDIFALCDFWPIAADPFLKKISRVSRSLIFQNVHIKHNLFLRITFEVAGYLSLQIHLL